MRRAMVFLLTITAACRDWQPSQGAVSYTHLDVYKRQVVTEGDLSRALEHPELTCYAVKIGKFGGVQPTLDFYREARKRGIELWMAGMSETGVSKRLHAAFETLLGVNIPGDISETSRYFEQDITDPVSYTHLDVYKRQQLDYFLHTPVYFVILPLFAFANAGVLLAGTDILALIMSPVTIGVFFGLLVGKPIGIFVATWLTVKLKISELPDGVCWGHILGVSILGGVGFTMAIFVTNLAFTDPTTIASAKIAIVAASLVAGLIGFFIRRREALCADCADDEPEQLEAVAD